MSVPEYFKGSVKFSINFQSCYKRFIYIVTGHVESNLVFSICSYFVCKERKGSRKNCNKYELMNLNFTFFLLLNIMSIPILADIICEQPRVVKGENLRTRNSFFEGAPLVNGPRTEDLGPRN